MAKSKKITTGGLGDKIKQLTEFLGIEQCDACKKRQELLNKLFPSEKATEMTDEELERFAEVKDKRHFVNEELSFIEELYFKTFNISKRTHLCRSCPPVWITVLDKLNKVYEIQVTNNNE